MSTYVVLIPADEAAWAAASAEERAGVYDVHAEFSRLLAERGHKVVTGYELAPSATAKVVRKTADGVAVTDGPYAEAVEQLSGFYVVESDDLDDLLEVVAVLADAESGIEVRPTASEG
jgi:hypothetical protein